MATLITIIGWLVGALWAVRQVEYAHQKNIKLQQSLLRQAFKDGLAKQFMDIHMNLCSALLRLRDTLTDVSNNMQLAERMNDNPSFEWQKLIENIAPAYSEAVRLFDRLDIWLDAAQPFLSNADRIANIIQDYKNNFTSQTTGLNPWLKFQAMLIVIRTSSQTDSDQYSEVCSGVEGQITEILKKKYIAMAVQRELSDFSALGI